MGEQENFEAKASSILDTFLDKIMVESSNDFFFDLLEKSIQKRYEKGMINIHDIDTFVNTLCLFVNKEEMKLPDVSSVNPQQEVLL